MPWSFNDQDVGAVSSKLRPPPMPLGTTNTTAPTSTKPPLPASFGGYPVKSGPTQPTPVPGLPKTETLSGFGSLPLPGMGTPRPPQAVPPPTGFKDPLATTAPAPLAKTTAPAPTQPAYTVKTPAMPLPMETKPPEVVKTTVAPAPAPVVETPKPAEAVKIQRAEAKAVEEAAKAKEASYEKAETHPATVVETKPATWGEALSDYQDFAARMVNDPEGFFKQYFAVATNRMIDSLALMNQSERDAMQMQINQNPALRGQGAGQALMQIMTRDQNFNLANEMGKLSQQAREMMIDLQKYGFEKGLEVNTTIRKRSLESYETLLKTGQFDAAAAGLQTVVDQDFPGLGIKIDAQTLAERDPTSRSNDFFDFSQQMEFIKDLALSNPTAAAGMVDALVSNPKYQKWFPAGATGEQLVRSLTDANVIANVGKSSQLQSEINTSAASGESFDEVKGIYDDLFRLSGRDALAEGKKVSLEDINAWRQKDGLAGQYSKDAEGNIVDETGLALDPEDYAQLAYRKDYEDKLATAKKEPWEASYRKAIDYLALNGVDITDTKLYPGGNDALKKIFMANSLGVDLFIKDPATGQMVPNAAAMNKIMTNPEFAPFIMNWPMAAFDVEGNVIGNYDRGGYVYGEIVNGKEITATPEDAELDKAYFAYRNTGGQLNPTEWYFATSGGKSVTPDETKIPAGVKTGEDFTDGNTGDGTPGTTTAKPGTAAASMEGYEKALTTSGGFSTQDQTNLLEMGRVIRSNISQAPESGGTYDGLYRLAQSTEGNIDRAVARLRKKGYAETKLQSMVKYNYDAGQNRYFATKEFAVYANYAALVERGMNEKDALAAMVALYGKELAEAGVALDTPKTLDTGAAGDVVKDTLKSATSIDVGF